MVATLQTTKIAHNNGTDAFSIATDGTITTDKFIIPPAGGIIQIQYTQFTGTRVISTSGDTSFSDLTVNITPVSTSSKIMLQAHVFGEIGNTTDDAWNHVFFFYRDSTKLAAPAASSRRTGIGMATLTYYGDDNNSTPQDARYDYFDEPNTTSQITYKVGYNNLSNSDFHLNRTAGDQDANYTERGLSFISATEIAG
jgi:hypothetical protein